MAAVWGAGSAGLSAVERKARRAGRIQVVLLPTLAVWLAVGSPGWSGRLATLAGLTLAVVRFVADLLHPSIWVTVSSAWNAVVALRTPLTILVTLAAAFAVMRGIATVSGDERTLRRRLRAWISWLRYYPSLAGLLLVNCVGLPIFWMSGDRGEAAQGHAIPVLTLLIVGAVVAMRDASWRRRVASLRPALALAHQVPEAVLEDAVFLPRRGDRQGLVMVSVPAKVTTHVDGLADGMAKYLHTHEAVVHPGRKRTVAAIDYRSVGQEETARRDFLAQTAGLVVSIQPAENPLPQRPDEQIVVLSESVTDAKAASVERELVAAYGLTVVEWPEQAREIRAARLDQRTVALRNDIAAWRKIKHAHLVEVQVEVDPEDRIVAVDMVRAPVIPDATARRSQSVEMMRDLLPPADGYDWTYAYVPDQGRIRTDLRKDPLLGIVPFTADPTEMITPDTPWRLGVDEDSQPIDIRLDTMGHGLIAGATRSGKSVCTYSLITHVLRMGDAARLLIADPNDTTLAPFEDKVSWGTTSTEPDAVTQMLEWCRDEMDRRKPIMRRMRTDAIREFGADLPLIVVIIDEAANYLRHSDKNAASALRGELLAVVSQGAKYGVRLVLITQRPDSTILDTATRAQLSFRISFRLEDAETAKMTFPDFEDPAVLLHCKPGVGWMREVGEVARRFRSVYLEDHWAVADRVPWRLPRIEVHGPGGPSNEPLVAPPGPTATGPAVEGSTVTDLGEMTLSPEDLMDLNDLEEFSDDAFTHPQPLARKGVQVEEDDEISDRSARHASATRDEVAAFFS